MSRIIRVLPGFTSLPGRDTVEKLLCTEGENVILLLMEDFHRPVFLYASLKALHANCTIPGGGDEAVSLMTTSRGFHQHFCRHHCSTARAWFGLQCMPSSCVQSGVEKGFKVSDPSAIVRDLLWEAGRRDKLWFRAADVFKFQYTSKQLQVLDGISRSCVVDGVAGFGKTEVMLGLVSHLIHHEQHPLVFITSETNAMAYKLHTQVEQFCEPGAALLLSVEDTGFGLEDHGNAFLQQLVDNFFDVELPLIRLLDHLIHIFLGILRRLRRATSPPETVIRSVMGLLLHCLAERHLTLHVQFYSRIRDYQREQIDQVCVVTTTAQNLLKIIGNSSSWSPYFSNERLRCLVSDELQFRGAEEAGVMIGAFDAFFSVSAINCKVRGMNSRVERMICHSFVRRAHESSRCCGTAA